MLCPSSVSSQSPLEPWDLTSSPVQLPLWQDAEYADLEHIAESLRQCASGLRVLGEYSMAVKILSVAVVIDGLAEGADV